MQISYSPVLWSVNSSHFSSPQIQSLPLQLSEIIMLYLGWISLRCSLYNIPKQNSRGNVRFNSWVPLLLGIIVLHYLLTNSWKYLPHISYGGLWHKGKSSSSWSVLGRNGSPLIFKKYVLLILKTINIYCRITRKYRKL